MRANDAARSTRGLPRCDGRKRIRSAALAEETDSPTIASSSLARFPSCAISSTLSPSRRALRFPAASRPHRGRTRYEGVIASTAALAILMAKAWRHDSSLADSAPAATAPKKSRSHSGLTVVRPPCFCAASDGVPWLRSHHVDLLPTDGRRYSEYLRERMPQWKTRMRC